MNTIGTPKTCSSSVFPFKDHILYGISALTTPGYSKVITSPIRMYSKTPINCFYYVTREQEIPSKFIVDGKVIPEVAILQVLRDNDSIQAIFETIEYFESTGDYKFVERADKLNKELKIVEESEWEWFKTLL